jgi:hypothetical protein
MIEHRYFPMEWEWSRWEPRMRRQTRRLVRRHRATIQRVADHLKKRKTLTAEEIDAIIIMTSPRDHTSSHRISRKACIVP